MLYTYLSAYIILCNYNNNIKNNDDDYYCIYIYVYIYICEGHMNQKSESLGEKHGTHTARLVGSPTFGLVKPARAAIKLGVFNPVEKYHIHKL